MTRVPAPLPRPPARVETGQIAAPKPRVVRRRKTSASAALTKKLAKWLRKKPKRTAYWTGVLHGVAAMLLVIGAFFIASILGTLLVMIAVLGVAWVVSRRG